jgi:hypothetical protein
MGQILTCIPLSIFTHDKWQIKVDHSQFPLIAYLFGDVALLSTGNLAVPSIVTHSQKTAYKKHPRNRETWNASWID